MDIPISILYLYIGISMTIGILGITLGLKKIAGSPFITIFAGIMLFGMIALIENVEVDYVEAIDNQLIYQMDQNVQTGTNSFSTTTTIRAQTISTKQSVLFNKEISCIDVSLAKGGSPTGNVEFAIFDGQDSKVKSFGNITASILVSSSQFYKKCLPNHDYYILSEEDRIGIKHTTSDGTNFVTIGVNTGNPFDGTNSHKSAFTSNSWTDSTTEDHVIRLYYDESNIIGKPVLHPLFQTDTWVFMSVLSFFFTYIGVMLQIRDWRK